MQKNAVSLQYYAIVTIKMKNILNLPKFSLLEEPQLAEEAVKSFETRYEVRITIHDRGGLLFNEAGQPFLPGRHHHEHPFCQTGRYSIPGWNKNCLEDCAVGVESIAAREMRPFLHSCWKGGLEVVTPIERNGILALVIYGGVFQAEADTEFLPGEYRQLPVPSPERLRELAVAMQILGRTLLEAALDCRHTQESLQGRKGEINQYITDHAHLPVKLTELSRKLNLSPSRTSHLVTKLFGLPFQSLLLQERMGRARNLLLSSDYPLKQIAQNTGFASEFYFNRAFREFYGLPPGEYKRKMSNDLRIENFQ